MNRRQWKRATRYQRCQKPHCTGGLYHTVEKYGWACDRCRTFYPYTRPWSRVNPKIRNSQYRRHINRLIMTVFKKDADLRARAYFAGTIRHETSNELPLIPDSNRSYPADYARYLPLAPFEKTLIKVSI